jgi:monofunctional biosynthetic peptidoglycan transglycosylase
MRRVSRWALIAGALGFGVLAYIYLTLPDVRPLATANPPTTAFIDLRAAEARAAGKAPRRNQRWIAYERISPHLKRAVLVAEDGAFWQHGGVDVEQLKQSMEANFEQGRFARGGSTITQQLAKNLYLSPSRNPMRKLRELIIARPSRPRSASGASSRSTSTSSSGATASTARRRRRASTSTSPRPA